MEEAAQAQSDRDARIAARRKRVQDRLAALRQGESSGGKAQEDQEELGRSQQQIIESRRRLLHARVKTGNDVNSVRLADDDAENQHRINEELMRQELRNKLLEEAEQSAVQNAAVAMKWANLFAIEVPQDLYGEMEQQREACEDILQSKTRLIKDIKMELKKKDDEYVKVLKKQAEDVDNLLQYMTRQYGDMEAAYREELGEVETAFLQERRELVDKNKAEVAELMDKRCKTENDFLERYLSTLDQYQRQLEDLRVGDAEDYQVLKIKLESDIASLEQHLETMRAAYQLNTEKLEYNYRVLMERDSENQSTIHQQKRKISRQRDVLNTLKQKYQGGDARQQEENAKLTDEYKRITEQFKDLQAKLKHFQEADERRYLKVWRMNHTEVVDLAKKMLKADCLLHEQQLGWAWEGPDPLVFVPPHEGTAGSPIEGVEGTTANSTPLPASSDGASTPAEKDSPALQDGDPEEVRQRLQQPSYLGALGLLCDEAGFLIDQKVRTLVNHLPPAEGGLVKAQAVIRALGITDGPTFDALMATLTNETPGTRGDVVEGNPEEGGHSSTLVKPDEVVKRLKAFIDQESSVVNRNPQGALGPRIAGMSRRAVEREREYWEALSQLVSDKNFRVWKALEKQLGRYLKLLKGRAASLQSVEDLQQQNTELRQLLSQYLSSKINEELKIPPTQVI